MGATGADPLDRLVEQLRILDTFERDRIVHWGDHLFRNMQLERKVVTSMVSEAAARRASNERPLGAGVLILDLSGCGGGIAAVDVIRQVMPEAQQVAYIGFGTPARGKRGLIERGLEELCRRTPGPVVRTFFCAGGLLDIENADELFAALSARYGWVVIMGFDGRVGRRGPAPLTPDDMRKLAIADTSVVSFLDPDALASQHLLLTLLARSLGQHLELEMSVHRDATTTVIEKVSLPPDPEDESARRALNEGLDSLARYAHRVRLRPMGSLRASGEIIEYDSPGFTRDHLMADLTISRMVPAGNVRVWLVDRLDAAEALV